jgi:hypothetical protein
MTEAAAVGTSSPAGSPEAPAVSGATETQETGAETPAQTAARIKKYKVKNREFSVDLSDEAKLDELVGKGLGADERFREAAEMVKSIEKKFGKLPEWQKNPFFKVIEQGADPLEVAEQLLLEKIKWEELTPEQREFEETRRERDKLKAEREAADAEGKKKAQAEASAKAAKEIDDEVTAALKEMGRKPTPRLIARIAETLIAEHERQIAPLLKQFGNLDAIPDAAFQAVKNLPASEAVGRVHKEYLSDIAEYLGALPIDEVRKYLPKQVLDGLRESEVKAVLSQDPMGSRKPREQAQSSTRPQVKKRMSTEQYFAEKLNKLG